MKKQMKIRLNEISYENVKTKTFNSLLHYRLLFLQFKKFSDT